MKRLSTLAILAILCSASALAVTQDTPARAPVAVRFPGADTEIYKSVGEVDLRLWIFEPPAHRPADRRPAVVFFFGGGWRNGSPTQFEHQARHFAARGMITVLADYRVSSRHGTRAVQCVADAKSAVRWLRANATRLGIDPHRIVASGGSAGGHIAACTGVIDGLDEPGEDMSVSSVPNALVLFNPAVVLAAVPGERSLEGAKLRWLQNRLGTEPAAISPYHHVKKGAPPTLIFHGKADSVVPFRSVELFSGAMRKAGNRCELVPYEGADHGFFNHGRGDGSAYRTTVARMDAFLVGLGYLAPEKSGKTEKTEKQPSSGEPRPAH